MPVLTENEMKNCKGCKFAEWKKTDAGKLHPSGDGKCTYEYKLPPLPACKAWIHAIHPYNKHGWINRKTEFQDHCPYYGA